MNRNILVVDDISFNRTVMKAALRELENINFIEAADGEQALEKLAAHEISLVILDLMMPKKNGFDVLEDMNKTEKTKGIPVIVYSAVDDIDSISQALELGAYDYFTKPLKPKQMNVILPMKVNNALKNYEQQKTIYNFNKKMKMDRLMANLLQQSLLTEKNEMSNVVMYGKYLPSEEIGGNYYESVQIGEKIWFIIAEVAGYGASAAMLSAMLKIEFHHQIENSSTPDKVLKAMNKTFFNITQNKYCLTAFVGVIDKGILLYSNAGQTCPLLYSAEQKSAQVLNESSFNIGMSADKDYELHNKMVGSGDIIMTYTQGLLEDKLINANNQVYEDLTNSFLNYKDSISDKPENFFSIMFRLFANIDEEKPKSDIAIMLICMK